MYGKKSDALMRWNASGLVGVEGSSIKVLGLASCDIRLAGILVKRDFLIAKTLSTEAIGYRFLENHGCFINTQQRVLHIQRREKYHSKARIGHPNAP